jgi:hypothetical protein
MTKMDYKRKHKLMRETKRHINAFLLGCNSKHIAKLMSETIRHSFAFTSLLGVCKDDGVLQRDTKGVIITSLL